MGHRGYESPSQVVGQGLQPHFHPPPSTSYPSTFHSFTPSYSSILHLPLHPLPCTLFPTPQCPSLLTILSPRGLTERPPSAFPSFFLSPFLHHILPSKVIFSNAKQTSLDCVRNSPLSSSQVQTKSPSSSGPAPAAAAS